MNPTYDFNGQVALVTGASTGIGFATAQAFARSGAAVTLVDRNEKALEAAVEAIVAAGHKAIAVQCDVSDEAQAAAAVERTVAAFGRLDMAYNNAGILGPMCPMSEETAEGFDEVSAVNLRGIWTFMKHELLQMKKQGGGAIVNCSSPGRTGRPAGTGGLPRDQARRHRSDEERRSRRRERKTSGSTPCARDVSTRPWGTASIRRR